MRLLAIFGAGCHMVDGIWVPTADFETWPLGGGGGRPIVREAFVDDENPNAVISMGELLLAAGVALYPAVRPDAVAIAYGDSSPSLQLAGHPSENEVMSRLFKEQVPEAKGEVFDPLEWKSGGKLSGTYNEAANLLRLMQRDGFDEIVILNREAHLRAQILTVLRLQEPEFADLAKKIRRIELHTVESVLLATDPAQYAERIRKIRRSNAYRRFLLREGNWWHSFITKGTSQIIQKPVEQAATK